MRSSAFSGICPETHFFLNEHLPMKLIFKHTKHMDTVTDLTLRLRRRMFDEYHNFLFNVLLTKLLKFSPIIVNTELCS